MTEEFSALRIALAMARNKPTMDYITELKARILAAAEVGKSYILLSRAEMTAHVPELRKITDASSGGAPFEALITRFFRTKGFWVQYGNFVDQFAEEGQVFWCRIGWDYDPDHEKTLPWL